jgi:hypothetical protein
MGAQLTKLKVKFKVTLLLTVSQSVSKSWCRAPYGGHDQVFITVWQLLPCFFSDERTGLSFVYAAGPRVRSVSRVRVPWNSRPYFTVSDLRLPFFVTSYDSQGYGGGIRPCLHTGFTHWLNSGLELSFILRPTVSRPVLSSFYIFNHRHGPHRNPPNNTSIVVSHSYRTDCKENITSQAVLCAR